MTSNIGASTISKGQTLGFGEPVEEGGLEYEEMKNRVTAELKKMFRPEFLNRVDDVVVFHPLARTHIRSIVDIQVGYLRKRLADREIELELDDTARDLLGEAGFDPVYGARPLKRAIQQLSLIHI